jgi:DNA-binding NarL/FixJ family response regulator
MASRPAGTAPVSSAPESTPPAAEPRPLLLIVEASTMLRRGWARRVAALGFPRVREAASRDEAIAALSENPDVILTAPGFPPFELVSRARAGGVPGSPWIVVISDRADRATVEAAHAAGADRYVLRPIEDAAFDRALAAQSPASGIPRAA